MDFRNYYTKIQFLCFFLLNTLKCSIDEDFIFHNAKKRLIDKNGSNYFFREEIIFLNSNNCNSNVKKNSFYSEFNIKQTIKSKYCVDEDDIKSFRFSLFRDKFHNFLNFSKKITNGFEQEDEILQVLSMNDYNYVNVAACSGHDFYTNPEDYVNVEREKKCWENVFEIIVFELFLISIPSIIWKELFNHYPILLDIISLDNECNLFIHLSMLKFDSTDIMVLMYDHIDAFTMFNSQSDFQEETLKKAHLKIDNYFFFFMITFYHQNFQNIRVPLIDIQKHVLSDYKKCKCSVCYDFKYFFTMKRHVSIPPSLKEMFRIEKLESNIIFFLTCMKEVFRLLWKCYGKDSFRHFRNLLIGDSFVEYHWKEFLSNYEFKGVIMKPISRIRDRNHKLIDVEKEKYSNFLGYPVLCASHWSHFEYIVSLFDLLKHEKMVYYMCKISYLENVKNISNFWEYFCIYYNNYFSQINYEDFVSFYPNHVIGRNQLFTFRYMHEGCEKIGIFFSSGLLFKLCFNSYHKQFFYCQTKLFLPFPISIYQQAKDIFENITFSKFNTGELFKCNSMINTNALKILMNILNFENNVDVDNGYEKAGIFHLIMEKLQFSRIWAILIKPFLEEKKISLEHENFEILHFSDYGENIYSSIECFFSNHSKANHATISKRIIPKIHKILSTKLYFTDNTDNVSNYLSMMPEMKCFLESALNHHDRNSELDYFFIRNISKNPKEICNMFYSLCASDSILSIDESVELFLSIRLNISNLPLRNIQLYKTIEESHPLFDDDDPLTEEIELHFPNDNLFQLILYSLYLSSFNKRYDLNLESNIITSYNLETLNVLSTEENTFKEQKYSPHGKTQFVGNVCFDQMTIESKFIHFFGDSKIFKDDEKEDSLNFYFFPIPIFLKRNQQLDFEINERNILDFYSQEEKHIQEALIRPKKTFAIYRVFPEIYNFLNFLEHCDRLLFVL